MINITLKYFKKNTCKKVHNFSSLSNMVLISISIFAPKLLNNLGVTHIVANMSQTLATMSTDCPILSSISCEVKNSLKLQIVVNIIWKIMKSSWSISSRIFSLLEVEIKPSLLEEEPFEELEKDIFQVLKWK